MISAERAIYNAVMGYVNGLHEEEIEVEDKEMAEEEARDLEADEDEEEGSPMKTRRGPKGPSKIEREQHEATHMPFRAWCPHCVKGRARNALHRKTTKETKPNKIKRPYIFITPYTQTNQRNRQN